MALQYVPKLGRVHENKAETLDLSPETQNEMRDGIYQGFL